MPKNEQTKQEKTKKKTVKKTTALTKHRKRNTTTTMEFWEEEHNLLRIKSWFRDEKLCNLEVAAKMGICEKTFYRWQSASPKIQEAIKEGKAPVDAMLVDAALKRAMGYDVLEYRMNESGEKTANQRHIPGSEKLLTFMLTNRMPHLFSNQQNISVEGELPIVIRDDIKE